MKKSIIFILVLIAAGVGYYFWKKKHHKISKGYAGNPPRHGTPHQTRPPEHIKPAHDNPQKLTYTIKSGDTLSKIARKFKTTVSKILAVNPQIKNKNLIYAGQTLNIPA